MITNLWDSLPSMPTLTREVKIPVYVIHNSPDPEDYFFIFDFELFVDRSKAGLFVRPKMKVWSGRHDFDRRTFARQFRRSFAAEFDAMRSSVGRKANSGWLSWGWGIAATGEFAATALLMVAMGAGRALTKAIPVPSWLKGRSEESKVEAQVEDMQGRVDAVLERIEIVLHRDLYAHAYRGQAPGPLTGMDYDAWPLPDFVAAHLGAKQSKSWW